MLLGQSYMPAQDLHVLRAPGSRRSPWFEVPEGALATPEWSFAAGSLRRFAPACDLD